MTFWYGVLVGWILGMATFPLLMLVVAKVLARAFDNEAHRERMSARWLRERQERGAHVSPGAKQWLREHGAGPKAERWLREREERGDDVRDD